MAHRTDGGGKPKAPVNEIAIQAAPPEKPVNKMAMQTEEAPPPPTKKLQGLVLNDINKSYEPDPPLTKQLATEYLVKVTYEPEPPPLPAPIKGPLHAAAAAAGPAARLLICPAAVAGGCPAVPHP